MCAIYQSIFLGDLLFLLKLWSQDDLKKLRKYLLQATISNFLIMKLIHTAASKCQCLASLALQWARTNKILLMMVSKESKSWALVFLQTGTNQLYCSFCKWNAASPVLSKRGCLKRGCKLSTRVCLVYMTWYKVSGWKPTHLTFVFSLWTSILSPPDGTMLMAFTDVAGC